MVNDYLNDDNTMKTNGKDNVDSGSSSSSSSFITSVSAIKNRRQSMEDRHVIIQNLNKALGLDVSVLISLLFC